MEICYSPPRRLSPNYVSRVFPSHHRKSKKRLALDEESDVDTPHDDCGRRNDLISVPNGNAGNLSEQLIQGHGSVTELFPKAYMRRTINSEEAELERKDKA